MLSAALGLVLAVLTACEPKATPLARTGTVREVINLVTARAAGESEFTAVNEGYLLASGGQIQTGINSRAKLVLNDGIIIRLAPVTLLTNNSPDTKWNFRLENGKIWLSLFGGGLTLETRLGSVTLFGNSVEFEYQPGDPTNPADDTFVIQCLQGTCRFQNGQSSIELNDLEQLVVTNNGGTVNRLKLSSAQVDEFIENNPETAGILAGLKSSAPRITTTAIVVEVPTLVFFSPATLERRASASATASRAFQPTPTRRVPTATSPFIAFTPTPTTGDGILSPTAPLPPPPPTSPPGGGPPTSTSTYTPQASSAEVTSTPWPTATPITPSPTVPTRTPPPTKTPHPTDTDTPLPTDTPPPTDTSPPTDTPTPSDTPEPTPTS